MPTPKNFHQATYELPLSQRQRRVVNTLHDSFGMSGNALGTLIGGKAASNPAAVRIFMSKLRSKMRGSGWTISSNGGGGHVFGVYAVIRGEQ